MQDWLKHLGRSEAEMKAVLQILQENQQGSQQPVIALIYIATFVRSFQAIVKTLTFMQVTPAPPPSSVEGSRMCGRRVNSPVRGHACLPNVHVGSVCMHAGCTCLGLGGGACTVRRHRVGS